ncbi:sensor histidine kinase [Larkinella humicola]|uniref:histidine kinase n=1 Tax=Larkinella humicola TaxID=2607654 RepID=A0A5N1JM67_9BACT|nr:PAS domain S-box protein [Larkinella humicola]KAA9357585.1 PAS domain S-box protein [Larkinella humicola]
MEYNLVNSSQSDAAGEGEMGAFIRSYDWSSTSLGAMDTWPASLRSTLRLVLHSRFPMAIYWAPDWICFYNDAFREILNDPSEMPGALGQRAETVWGEAWPLIRPLIEQAFAGRANWNPDQRLPLVRPERHQEVYWTVSYSPFFDEQGQSVGVLVTGLETTEQVAIRERIEALTRSEERYHKMVDEVQDYAILLLDREGIILNWNKGAQRIKGYSEAEIIGKSFVVFYLPEDRAKKLPEQLIAEAFQEGRARHEGWRIRKDGSMFWGSIVITALHDEKGGIIGFSKVTRDLTEKKLAEDQLRQYSRELEIQNKELEQFAYIASHDLQEPLRKIQTFSGLLKENLDQPEVADRYLTKIEASAQRMSKLIKEVLNYSRLAILEEEFVAVDLNETLHHVLVDFELLIDEKGAVIRADDLPVIDGIPLQLNQLFYNLLSNALKFSQQTPHIQITSAILTAADMSEDIGLKPLLTYLQLVFKDNGIGFDAQFSRQIFTIFQRLNTSKHYSGTGIGLALCKKIVDNHQGIIYARSTPNQGAAFYVYLPVSRKPTEEPA